MGRFLRGEIKLLFFLFAMETFCFMGGAGGKFFVVRELAA